MTIDARQRWAAILGVAMMAVTALASGGNDAARAADNRSGASQSQRGDKPADAAKGAPPPAPPAAGKPVPGPQSEARRGRGHF